MRAFALGMMVALVINIIWFFAVPKTGIREETNTSINNLHDITLSNIQCDTCNLTRESNNDNKIKTIIAEHVLSLDITNNNNSKTITDIQVRVIIRKNSRVVPFLEKDIHINIPSGIEPNEKISKTLVIARWMMNFEKATFIGDTSWQALCDLITVDKNSPTVKYMKIYSSEVKLLDVIYYN